MSDISIRLRPVADSDLTVFRRFLTEPGLIGLDWTGFKDAQEPARRFAVDGYLSATGGRLMVEAEPDEAAGFVSWSSGDFGGLAKHWEIGIALLPQWRGKGIGWLLPSTPTYTSRPSMNCSAMASVFTRR